MSVAKVTPEKAKRILQYVLDCSIRRLTAEETAEYLQRNGLPSNIRTVKRYRTKIRESAQNWIARLAKSKRADYIAEYKERIDEVRAYQRELWNICNDKGTFQRVKVESISKLLDCTARLVELYDAIPIVTAIRDYGCGYDHDNKQLQQYQEQRQQYDRSTDSLA